MSSNTEQRLEENDDPQEVVGPDECNSSMSGTSLDVEDVLNDEQDISFPAGMEISEQFVANPVPIGVDATDGMPRPLDDIHALPVEPPFNHQARVCMEDDREWIEMLADELPEEARHSPPGFIFECQRRFDHFGQEATRRKFSPDSVNGERFGIRTSEYDIDGMTRVWFVKPRRQACKHFVRTVLCHDPTIPFGEIGHEMMYRNCSARRSVGGALMSLNGEGVYACELREPRDEASEIRHIRIPDRKRLTQAVDDVPLFNLSSK